MSGASTPKAAHDLPERVGRYRIHARLATGGMAEILLGRLRGPGGFERPVVVKRVLPHLARQKAFRNMFLDEARIVANIRHPNVVQVQELGQEDAELFLVMEYLEGESLGSLMRRLGDGRMALPHALAAHIVAEACAGLHAAHELRDGSGKLQNVIHRDVSPQNVFVTYQGGVKVIDFGIATAADRFTKTQAGELKGKFAYMAPEQYQRQDNDRRVDVFALGVVLYELTTLRKLFKRENEFMTMRAICEEPVPPPSLFVMDYPPALERICMRALARNPADRYATAAEMEGDLLEFAQTADPRLRVKESLVKLMQGLFADRIAEKAKLLQHVDRGAVVTTVIEAETGDSDLLVDVVSEPPPFEPQAEEPSRVQGAGRRPSVVKVVAVSAVLAAAAGGAWVVVRSRGAAPAVPRGEAASAAPRRASVTPPEVAPSRAPDAGVGASAADVAAAQEAASTVRLTLVSQPAGASVSVDGVAVGAAPYVFETSKGRGKVAVTFALAGYDPVTEEVLLAGDERVRVTLTKARGPGPTRRRGRVERASGTAEPPSAPAPAPTPPPEEPKPKKPAGFYRFE